MSLRVRFVKSIEVGDWHIENITLEDWEYAHGTLRFDTVDSDYADELDKSYDVRVPSSNIVYLVGENDT
jgi:hypothetical protein